MVRHPVEHFFEKPPRDGHGVVIGRRVTKPPTARQGPIGRPRSVPTAEPHARLRGPGDLFDTAASLSRACPARGPLHRHRSRAGPGAHTARRRHRQRPVPSPLSPRCRQKSPDHPVFSPCGHLAGTATVPADPSRTRQPPANARQGPRKAELVKKRPLSLMVGSASYTLVRHPREIRKSRDGAKPHMAVELAAPGPASRRPLAARPLPRAGGGGGRLLPILNAWAPTSDQPAKRLHGMLLFTLEEPRKKTGVHARAGRYCRLFGARWPGAHRQPLAAKPPAKGCSPYLIHGLQHRISLRKDCMGSSCCYSHWKSPVLHRNGPGADRLVPAAGSGTRLHWRRPALPESPGSPAPSFTSDRSRS